MTIVTRLMRQRLWILLPLGLIQLRRNTPWVTLVKRNLQLQLILLRSAGGGNIVYTAYGVLRSVSEVREFGFDTTSSTTKSVR